ncbi:MAG: sulfatase, partial [Rubrobacter sp.]
VLPACRSVRGVVPSAAVGHSRVRRFSRRDFLKLAGAGAAGATLLGGGVLAGCDTVRESVPDLQNRIPFAGPDTNVVLVIIDSLRKDHIGAYGNTWIQSPNLDALAGESLRFTRAHPESIPTICARRAIHTGTRSWPFKDWQVPKGEDIILQGWQPVPRGQVTLAEVMRESGYQTMLVTDNMHLYKPSYDFQRGFDAFDYFRGQTTDNYAPNWAFAHDPESREKVQRALLKGNVPAMTAQMRQYFSNVAGRRSEEDWFSPKVFTAASNMLEFASEGPPFFMVVDSYDPHEPWDPPEDYVQLYDDGPYDLKEPYSIIYGPSDYLVDRELERMRARYAAELTMMDRWLGRFLDKMEELGLFENTLLVLLSDHGIPLGEHGITGKPPYSLYPELTDIPFFIRHPEGQGAGEASDYHASTHDVAPTILGFLGIDTPEQMEGQDLSVVFGNGQPEERAHFTAGYNEHVWARDNDYALICKYDGSEALLFDLQRDPEMRQDVAVQNQPVLNRMFTDYVLADAGGPLPVYENPRPS